MMHSEAPVDVTKMPKGTRLLLRSRRGESVWQITSIRGNKVYLGKVDDFGNLWKERINLSAEQVAHSFIRVVSMPNVKEQKSLKLSDEECEKIFREAIQAGEQAMRSVNVTPMVVVQHENPFDDSSPIIRQDVVRQGPCGFAWVNIRPGNSSFARYLKKTRGASQGYYGGINYRISAGGQSIQLKEAYAAAFAQVCRKYGIKAYADSRMD